MKEYKKVLVFEYKNKKYEMFLDNNNRKFFMKKDNNGNLAYVTDAEFAELTIFFTSVPKIMKIVKDSKINIIPKVISKGITVALSLSVLTAGLSNLGLKVDSIFPSQTTSEVIETEEDLKKYVSLAEEGSQKASIDTYEYNGNGKILEIYDMEYLDMAFENENIDIYSLKKAIYENDSIPDTFKSVLNNYAEDLVAKYTNIDLRVFYNNLKDLKVKECSKDEIYEKTGVNDSYGCYVRDTNEIYVLEGIDYDKNSWARQVIYHELSHCLRIGNYQIDGIKVKVLPEGQTFNNEIAAEALNSLFAVSLFDYEEDSIAYQLQSNYYKIMLDCMDNYDLSDYINHSLSYFTSKLDEYNDSNYSSVVLVLIQTQFQDYHSSYIKVEQSEYYPIYDYICEMYYKKNISEDMTYEQMQEVANNLVKKVTLYVPNEYNIDTNRFYENLNTYINQLETNEKTL